MRANKLETALSRDCLACLAPPDMFFFMQSIYYTTNFLFTCYLINFSLTLTAQECTSVDINVTDAPLQVISFNPLSFQKRDVK